MAVQASYLRKNLYIVRGKNSGRMAWHIVLIDLLKDALFQQAIKSGTLDVKHYGKVIESGWGENPPQQVIDRIDSEY